MTTSRRLAERKVVKFEKNITKRGTVPETTLKKGKDYPVGPILLGFFVFVVIGSSLFQIIRTATSGGMALAFPGGNFYVKEFFPLIMHTYDHVFCKLVCG